MIKKVLALILLCYAFVHGMAQDRQSGYHIGFLGGQSKAVNGNDSAYFVVNGGQVIQSGKVDVVQDEQIVTSGFPYPVKYFKTTFDEDFFVSKGYFPDVVQLNWRVLSASDEIRRLLLYRKPLGTAGDSLLVATLASDEFSFRDEFVEGGVLYKYTLFAEGLADELRLPFINYVESTGFAFPVGTATGRITYEGGTAVEGVTILAETDGNLKGKSLYLDGDEEAYLRFLPETDDEEMSVDNGFTFQLWTRFEGVEGEAGTLLSRGQNVNLSYDGNQLAFKAGDVTANLVYQNPVDSFFHVSAVYDPEEQYIALYARTNARSIDSVRVAISMPVQIPESTWMYIGKNDLGNFYTGYIDEIRQWKKPLPFSQIDRDYSRFLSGSEDNFAAYWRLSAGVEGDFYDFSRQGGFDFNENHGQVIRAQWTDMTPLNSQLAYLGVTDQNGNYTITGFPFETQGSLYTFTPIFENHSFEPTQQLRFVGDGTSIFNEVDFDDVSSFPVSGTVFYKNTPFPVEGVSLTVDGRPAVSRDGTLILTDANGEFTIDVPIGFHSVQVSKNQHGFEGNGRFPPLDEGTDIPLFDFQNPLSGLVFQDTTLVKLAGRVVGGPIEQGKPLGFGLSKNNIGHASIFLRPQKAADLTFSPADSLSNPPGYLGEKKVTTSVNFNLKDVAIYPDQSSGEFIALLPPEKYVINDVRAGTYDFDASYNTTVNLEQTTEQSEVVKDTLAATFDGEPVPGYPPYDESDYDSILSEVHLDTTYTIGVDSFFYDLKKDFILRVTPTIDVANATGEDFFGEEVYVHEDANTGTVTEIPLLDDQGNYSFGFPVFNQRAEYALKISLFEEYVNADNANMTDQVPVIDGYLSIHNDLAVNTDEFQLELDESGKVIYRFFGGLPNANLDATNPANSYTKLLNITSFSGNNHAIKTIWRETDPFRGYIFGGLPTGNNFVTTGPNQIDMILRDPPGSDSFSFIEKSTTSSSSYAVSVSDGSGTSMDRSFQLGFTLETAVGLGAEVTTELEVSNETTAGFSTTQTFNSNDEFSNTITNSEIISTSADPTLVGADGDLFIGRATNIVYGISNFVEPVPATGCTDGCLETAVNGFKIGKDTGLRLNPEFATGFVFSQFHIEQVLLPDLELIRNSFLTYSTRPDTIVPLSVPVYVSLLSPSDEHFGSDNTDKAIWGGQASLFSTEGPSYHVVFPENYEGSKNDTILYFNGSIRGWKHWLSFNEEQKLKAVLQDNRSFDAGAILEQSIEITASKTTETSYEFNIDAQVANELGMELNGTGTSTTIAFNTSQSFGKTSSSSTETTTTFGFTLADGDLGDSYTVDIKKSEDGYGPVFSTRGGATSCPYEGEIKTKYYKPGKEVLHVATAQREVPELSVESAIVSDIPANRPAIFQLYLQNNSETEEGFEMEIDLVDGTNPHGAILEIDGTPLGNGLVFNVPAGQTLTKTLTLRQGQAGVFEYEDVGVELRSLCQSDPNDNLEDINDNISISAYFTPGCSDIAITDPVDQWVLNTRAALEDVVSVNIADYDLNHENFERIDLQYKPASSSQWITTMKFYNNLNVTQAEFDALDNPKQMIDGATVAFDFDMGALPDRAYNIRAVSTCVLGPGHEETTPSEILNGIKDTDRPKLFGAPQPADGILSAGDEISIRFDETIEAGLLNKANLSIKGVLNNTQLSHNTSVRLDGISDYVRVPAGLSLADKSFTIFSWIRRSSYAKEQVLFSKGTNSEDVLEYGFTSDSRFFIDISGQRTTSTVSFPDLGVRPYEYLAISYDHRNDELNVIRNGEFILEGISIGDDFAGAGAISIGKSEISGDRFFDGNVHEWRIWSTARGLGEIAAASGSSLNGSEINLIGYWSMNEAIGDIGFDLARSRHATVFAGWAVEPGGYAFEFDGKDDYVEMNTANTVTIDSEQDFTVEFWFKASPGQGRAIMFANGKGDGTDQISKPQDSWTIGFNDDGAIQVMNNGLAVLGANVEGGSYQDDQWHHLALTINRIGALNLLVDQELKASQSSDRFGGLLGSRMWLGARGYRKTNATNEFDQFFEGKIDEFRIWNTFKRVDDIMLNRLNKLRGDEIGLVAYYPFDGFETQTGINVLVSTLEDQFNNPFGSNGGLAINKGASDFTNETPATRLTRPVQEVDFDYVVNDDEIILTPANSFAPLIEKVVLEIGIRTAEDQFENRLASPVTWTAYVDRNQVKWDETSLTFEKLINEPLTFQVSVINAGGKEESYSIDNLPLWLTAEPASGVLAPKSSQIVEFRVNPGLNVGHYEEDLLLSSEQGFVEKLQLNLRVFHETPDWQVDPKNYQFSMNIIADLEIKGVKSTDRYDQIAMYHGDQVRGVANIQYVKSLDTYLAFIDVYSNTTGGEALEIRVWDDDKGLEYRDALPGYTFQAEKILGDPQAPEHIRTSSEVLQTIPIKEGWNWISLNVDSDVKMPNDMFEYLSFESGDQIKGIDKVDIYTSGIGWLGSVSANGGLTAGSLYKVKSSDEDIIELVGERTDPLTIIEVQKGWNWIGYIPPFNLTLDEAFAGLQPDQGDVVKSQFAFALYDDQLGWLGSLNSLEPGKGYMYLSGKPAQFRYPKNTFLVGRMTPEEPTIKEKIWQVADRNYSATMTMTIQVSGISSEHTTLGVFAKNENRGSVAPVTVDGEMYYFLTIHGNQSVDLDFRLMDHENGDLHDLQEELTFLENAHLGTVKEPYRLTVAQRTEIQEVVAFPNPFSSVIDIYVPELDGKYTLTVKELSGKILMTQKMEGAKQSIHWDGRLNDGTSLPVGLYVLSVETSHGKRQIKIIKH